MSRTGLRRDWETIVLVKKEAMAHFADQNHFVLDVHGLSKPERNIVRTFCNRWMRNHGKRGKIHFDPDLWTLSVTVIGPRSTPGVDDD